MFSFKQFDLTDSRSGMKIGTDGVLLGAWAQLSPSGTSIVDAGAGCGLIALMLAQRYPIAGITAVELDPDASADCISNIAASLWAGRVEVVEGDFIDFASSSARSFSLIVSNPPFFTSGAISPEAKRASARHEASLSCTSLIESASRILASDGFLSFIAPAERESELIFAAELRGLKLHRLCRVSSTQGKPPVRVMMEFSPADTLRPQISSLSIRTSSGSFTEPYIMLTKDFYLHF